jgi:hypothetical protein
MAQVMSQADGFEDAGEEKKLTPRRKDARIVD